MSIHLTTLLVGLALPSLPPAGPGERQEGEKWLQSGFDEGRSGYAPDRAIRTPLGLLAAIPMSDAVYTSPVVANGLLYVLDGSGVLTCVDVHRFDIRWKYETPGGSTTGSTVSSPALSGEYLHFGTASGNYYVLDALSGTLVREIPCESPIWCSPVASGKRVYFVTAGARVYALESDGRVAWTWDFVREVLEFTGNRWDSNEWMLHRKGRLKQSDRFLSSGNIAASDGTVVVPAGGAVVWLNDLGIRPHVRSIRRDLTSEFGLVLGEDGKVYQQWHDVDNRGSVRVLVLSGRKAVMRDEVPGTRTGARLPNLMGFSSVALKGSAVFRTRPQAGFGLCRHDPDLKEPQVLCSEPAIASPVVLRKSVVYGDLRGSLHVVPLSGGKPWTFKTAFGKPISAAVAVSDGRIYFGSEDGYVYVLGPGGKAPLPTIEREHWRIRSPLSSALSARDYDRYTSFGDFANTNANQQGVKPPFRLKWIRKYEGTTKHASTCGGGRLYTHTSEGQVFAVEQESGRLLWRTYFPGVHLSFTSPLYHDERLLVPQAGPTKSLLRCLDAATGRLLWEAPFSGSPNWTRQAPPVVSGNLAIYAFSSGKFGQEAEAQRGKLPWLFSIDGFSGYPRDCKPLVRAYDLGSGKQVWEQDFSKYGSGGDEAGLCLMDGMLYYSCFFGRSPERIRGKPGASGLTAAIRPESGRIVWYTTEYSATGHATLSAEAQRLYLGGFNPQPRSHARRVVCLDARDGSLIWKSDCIGGLGTTPVVTLGSRFLYAHSQNSKSVLLDKASGSILQTFAQGSRCTRFTLSEPFLFGANLDVFDLSDPSDVRLVASGPRLDVSECNAAIVSNGRIFTTGQASGIQISQVYGLEAIDTTPVKEPKR